MNKFLQAAYKINYHKVSFSLLLLVSPTVYAQQLICNPECNGDSGSYISETERDGNLILNNVTLNSIAPPGATLHPGDSKYSAFAPIVVALGVNEGNHQDLHLKATNLIINTTSSYKDNARAIAVASNLANERSVNLISSNINLTTTANAANKNTIGILMEADATGQIYNVSLQDTEMHIRTTANNNTVGGIWAYSNYGFAQANITLDRSNLTIESPSGSAYGIRTENKTNPSISVINIQDVNPGLIDVTGSTSAYGIGIDTLGKSTYIDNKSDINVKATSSSSQAYGIYTRTQENTIKTNAQNINVSGGNQAYGINVSGAGSHNISNTATMKVEALTQAVGISAQSTSNTGDVNITTGGKITVRGTGNTYGISAVSQGNITIQVANKIDATNGIGTGIYARTTTGSNSITLHNGADIIGGSSTNSSGVQLQNTAGNQELTLNQGSQISSLNDLALTGINFSGNTNINNNGQITGFSTLRGGNVSFNNQKSGTLKLKYFNNSIKKDIIYTIGTAGGVLNNAGLIKFSDENFDGTPTNAVFNVDTFKNSGIIDLTGKNPNGTNNLVGDTFTINGNYVSDGGSIYLNTQLDDALTNNGQGVSDLLVINGNVTLGSGATALYITPTASTANLGQLTTGDGIKVVDVQGTSSSDAFRLGRPVVAGTYEYTLNQGKTDDSWYLSSYYQDSTPDSNDDNSNTHYIIQYNPALGAYLANQTAAVQMFQQTLFDRLTSAANAQSDDALEKPFWIRTKISRSHYNSIHGGVSNRSHSYSLQMGKDLNVWTLNNGGYFRLGVMGGYGNFKDISKSNTTGTRTDGKVQGYTLGIYATYFANQNTRQGLYVDLWSQMGWYRNEISGKAQIETKKYNSSVWSNSIELGYSIPFAASEKYQWLVTPQTQLTYNSYHANNQFNKNNLYVSNNNASGLNTRLGVRLHAQGVNENLLEPFLEVNWLSTTAKNKLTFNGTPYKDGFAKDRLELKLGLQGSINKRWNVSAQVEGQWGHKNYNSYQGQLNLNYNF